MDRTHIWKERQKHHQNKLWIAANGDNNKKGSGRKYSWRRGLTNDLNKFNKTWKIAKQMATGMERWNETIIALCP